MVHRLLSIHSLHFLYDLMQALRDALDLKVGVLQKIALIRREYAVLNDDLKGPV